MTYRIATILMTLTKLKGHAPIAGLVKCNFLYSYAAVDRISTDLERRAVPLSLQIAAFD